MVLARMCIGGLLIQCPSDYWQVTAFVDGDPVYLFPGDSYLLEGFAGPLHMYTWPTPYQESDVDITVGGPCDVNLDAEEGTDADIQAFFAALTCGDRDCASVADWDNDGEAGTAEDVRLFFQSLRR